MEVLSTAVLLSLALLGLVLASLEHYMDIYPSELILIEDYVFLYDF